MFLCFLFANECHICAVGYSVYTSWEETANSLFLFQLLSQHFKLCRLSLPFAELYRVCKPQVENLSQLTDAIADCVLLLYSLHCGYCPTAAIKHFVAAIIVYVPVKRCRSDSGKQRCVQTYPLDVYLI